MPRRTRTATRRTGRSPNAAWFYDAARGMLERIDEVLAETERLGEENARLRQELDTATRLIAQVGEALGRIGTGTAPGRRTRPRADVDGAGSRRLRVGRVTPESITPEVVRSVISRLGSPSAAEIAAELRRGGQDVSGRAIRFIAERSGARAAVDAQGTRRYST